MDLGKISPGRIIKDFESSDDLVLFAHNYVEM